MAQDVGNLLAQQPVIRFVNRPGLAGPLFGTLVV